MEVFIILRWLSETGLTLKLPLREQEDQRLLHRIGTLPVGRRVGGSWRHTAAAAAAAAAAQQ